MPRPSLWIGLQLQRCPCLPQHPWPLHLLRPDIWGSREPSLAEGRPPRFPGLAAWSDQAPPTWELSLVRLFGGTPSNASHRGCRVAMEEGPRNPRWPSRAAIHWSFHGLLCSQGCQQPRFGRHRPLLASQLLHWDPSAWAVPTGEEELVSCPLGLFNAAISLAVP